MHIVHVFLHVKEEHLDAFKAATAENARNSIQEPGITRFDVIQQADDPTRFVLVEVYRQESDTALHRQTQHFKHWLEMAAPMLVSERERILYHNVFPADEGWEKPAA